jgi:protein-S-isoprenylcysteine O-methyltransferase Ste14
MAEPEQDSPGVIVFPPLLYAIALALGVLLDFLHPIHPFPTGPARILGALLLVASMALAIWGRRTMSRAGTNIDPRQPAVVLVTNGPFRFSRNPLYVALTGLYVGVALLIDGLWTLLLLVPLLVVTQQGIVRREERYLERKFGEEYRTYKIRVRRWI